MIYIFNLNYSNIFIKTLFLILIINIIIYILILFTIKFNIKKFDRKNYNINIYEFGSTVIGYNVINNLNFYIIAILFIIFDLELIFFIP